MRLSIVRIGGITDISTVDWYGNVSLVVFFAGCNFRCPYCQNSSLIPINSGEDVSIELIQKRIEDEIDFIDAVVCTGGEPLLQPMSLLEVAKLVKKLNLKLMIDTNGSIPSVIRKIIDLKLVDRMAIDVKAPFNSKDYCKTVGLTTDCDILIKKIEKSLDICKKNSIDIEARTTIVPTLSDNSDYVRQIASNIKDKCVCYYLQQFDNTGDILSQELTAMLPPSRERLVELATIAISEGLKSVYIKTRKYGLEHIS
jgi:pyruvate formate lyase activating enzyme